MRNLLIVSLLALASATTNAAVVTLDLIEVRSFAVAQGAASQSVQFRFPIVTGGVSGAPDSSTWEYDTVTDIVSQTGGTFAGSTRLTVSPFSTLLFTHNATGMTMGAGGAAAATSWTCTEGAFGAGVGAHLCGNYSFGANALNESTFTQGTTGGAVVLNNVIVSPPPFPGFVPLDDAVVGPPQSIASFNGMSTLSWDGATLVIANGAFGDPSGSQWTFGAAVVPVPAAVWLFGSALGLLGWVRRRKTA